MRTEWWARYVDLRWLGGGGREGQSGDGWMEREILGGRNLSLEEGRKLAEDRVRWKAVVKGDER